MGAGAGAEAGVGEGAGAGAGAGSGVLQFKRIKKVDAKEMNYRKIDAQCKRKVRG